MEIDFRQGCVDDGAGVELIAAMRAEMAELYPTHVLDGPDMPKAGPNELGPPDGEFVIGLLPGAPICCGGFKRLPDGECELKRMYVVPEMRGRGVARVLLRELERRAQERGYAIARLDTGPRQPHARRLFESESYVAIENFNANPIATFFGEKSLA